MNDILDAILSALSGGTRVNFPFRIILCGLLGAFLAYTLVVVFDMSPALKWPYVVGFLAGALYGWRWYMNERR